MDFFEGDFLKKGAFLKNPDDGSLIIASGGQLDIVKDFSSPQKDVFYLKDFYSENFLRYLPEKILRLSVSEQKEFLHSLPESDPKYQSIGTEDRIYEEDFRDLMRTFGGALRKVVMISRENFIPDEYEVFIPHLIRKALTFGAGIPYGLWGKDFGIIGSTPEELFHIKDGLLTTHALAGTAEAGKESELLSSTKDLLEHNLVIQDITEKLTPYSNNIETGETHCSPFKNIIHLKTDIKAAVSDDINLSSLVSALSPTAALGGYPKKESMKFLRDTRYSRKYPERSFGSAMGMVTGNEARFIVMIRNVQWRNDTLFIESGGGVVPGSELKKELKEISWKRNLVKDHYLC